MLIREVRLEEKEVFNKVATHPLQSWEWGEFREKTGVKVVRLGQFEGRKLIAGFQITFHKLPKFNLTIGYLPKSVMPDKELFEALTTLGRQERAIFIKLEPSVGAPVTDDKLSAAKQKLQDFLLSSGCVPGRPQFTKYTFQIDLTKNEEELMAQMNQKTRYNVGLAQRKGVTVTEDNSDKAFNAYLDLTFEETTKRQKFYAHTRDYHQKMWEILRPAGIAHLLVALYQSKILVAWILLEFNKTLYYPYGASSSENRQVMASNLIMWEAIRFGKKLGCHTFDLWGCLGPDPNPKDPWFGFHRFKRGYGSSLIEFLGTFDFIIDPSKYRLYKIAESLRWKWLRLKTVLPF